MFIIMMLIFIGVIFYYKFDDTNLTIYNSGTEEITNFNSKLENNIYNEILKPINLDSYALQIEIHSQNKYEETRNLSRNKSWNTNVKKRDNYTCCICGSTNKKDMVAHHLNSFNWCVKGREDINNGICLCNHCHKQFHEIFGYGENTSEQFEYWSKGKVEHISKIYDFKYKIPIIDNKINMKKLKILVNTLDYQVVSYYINGITIGFLFHIYYKDDIGYFLKAIPSILSGDFNANKEGYGSIIDIGYQYESEIILFNSKENNIANLEKAKDMIDINEVTLIKEIIDKIKIVPTNMDELLDIYLGMKMPCEFYLNDAENIKNITFNVGLQSNNQNIITTIIIDNIVLNKVLKVIFKPPCEFYDISWISVNNIQYIN